MRDAAKRLGRAWTTIFVVWALVLQVFAAGVTDGRAAMPSGHDLCLGAAGIDDGSSAPTQPSDRHAGDLCCILCLAGPLAEPPATIVPIAAPRAVIRVAVAPRLGVLSESPERAHAEPRAPPVPNRARFA